LYAYQACSVVSFPVCNSQVFIIHYINTFAKDNLEK
jgi:hypothetical protein